MKLCRHCYHEVVDPLGKGSIGYYIKIGKGSSTCLHAIL